MPKSRREPHLISPKTEELRRRVESAKRGGGPERVQAQKAQGKLLARERLDLLLDDDSFEEIDLLVDRRPTEQYCEEVPRPKDVGKRPTEFGLAGRYLPGDGVITGIGRVHGRGVAVFSQDFTVLGGSLGLGHAMKICKLLDLAMESGVPVIGLCDSGGARIQEGVAALGGYAEIFWRNVQASGRVPQISAILGPCAGGAVYSPAITDFVFMVEGTSHMFITGPDVVRAATGETTDFESLGGAQVHGTRSGVCHFVAASEQDCFRQIRELIEYLPQNCFDAPRAVLPSDDSRRRSPLLRTISEMDPKKPFRVHDVIWEIADSHSFMEVHRHFAENIVVGFMRLGGRPVGVVANNPSKLSGALDIAASEKGARFVRFCDAFNIPLLTLVDVPGYWPGVEQEHAGIIRKGAKLLYAYAEATVPKVTVILRKAYGGAYDVMSSKHIRGDFNFAWPCAEIAVMGPAGAVDILFKRELDKAKNREKRRVELVEEYRRNFANPFLAARNGYIDEVIEAADTRVKLVRAFGFLKSKKIEVPPKKHGNIPL